MICSGNAECTFSNVMRDVGGMLNVLPDTVEEEVRVMHALQAQYNIARDEIKNTAFDGSNATIRRAQRDVALATDDELTTMQAQLMALSASISGTSRARRAASMKVNAAMSLAASGEEVTDETLTVLDIAADQWKAAKDRIAKRQKAIVGLEREQEAAVAQRVLNAETGAPEDFEDMTITMEAGGQTIEVPHPATFPKSPGLREDLIVLRSQLIQKIIGVGALERRGVITAAEAQWARASQKRERLAVENRSDDVAANRNFALLHRAQKAKSLEMDTDTHNMYKAWGEADSVIDAEQQKQQELKQAFRAHVALELLVGADMEKRGSSNVVGRNSGVRKEVRQAAKQTVKESPAGQQIITEMAESIQSLGRTAALYGLASDEIFTGTL